MHLYHSLVQVSMAVYQLHCHMLLYTKSVDHVTVGVGQLQFGEARGTGTLTK